MSTPSRDRPHSHYSDPSPTTESQPRVIRIDLDDLRFEIETDTGVFGRRRLDPGTEILLREAPDLPSTGTFLDLGCGAGPIGLVMAARRPMSRVWAIDINDRARTLTRSNAHRLGLRNVCVESPDDVPSDLLFDVIWSNPPIKVGKSALHSMLTTWLNRLTLHGTAVLVVHKNLGSDSLAEWLLREGWEVDRLTSRRGYRLLCVARGRPGSQVP